MTRIKAITLGVFTVWPFVYMLLFIGFAIIFPFVHASSMKGRSDSILFFIIFPLHILTILEIFVLLAIYIHDLYHTKHVPEDKKTLWAVVLFMGNFVAMSVYWYHYIWTPTKSYLPGNESNAHTTGSPGVL
jgi:hypothetical protein